MKNIFLILPLILIVGCAQMQSFSSEKFAPELLLNVTEYKDKNSNEKISFIGRSNKDIYLETRKDIEETGVDVGSVIKDVFTGMGDYTSIIKLSNKNYIIKLDAPKKLFPLKGN